MSYGFIHTGQMVQLVRCLLLVRDVWGSSSKPIKSPKRCQRLATTRDTRKGIKRV